MNAIDRLRYALAPPALKAAAVRSLLPIIAPWVRATFFDESFYSLNNEAYKKNSAVFACVSAIAFAFIEPPLKWYDKEREELPDHPMRQRIIRPNDTMGEGELLLHTITYMAIGGNAYWHKLRNSQGGVIGLTPFHIGNISPVPNYDNIPDKTGRVSWILRYDFDDGAGKKRPVDKRDIVHFKWPSVDMGQPWVAMPPLLPALREVATDNEAIRYLKAILQNDAVPRMVMYVPPDSDLDLGDEEKQNKLKAQFRAKYGGDNRGDLAIVTGGAKMERISLNLEELAFDAIHRIPESRITAALRVPAIIAGLNTGIENSTYSNFREARELFTRATLNPLWNLCASEIAADTDLNPNGDFVGFDLNKVEALQEDRNEKWARLTVALNAGGITINDFLRGVGLPVAQTGGDIRLIDSTKFMVNVDEPKETPIKEIMSYHIQYGAVDRDEIRAGLGLPPQGENVPLAGVGGQVPGAGKGTKESDQLHTGLWVDLMCPICDNVGVNVFDDHKGLAVCPACTCTFDPAIEEATIGTNGKH